LENGYGAQALDDMVNEKILDAAIAKSNIKVDEAKFDEQLKNLETQFESTGGLDEALKQRGLTRKDLEKQIRTQLAVEELLADKIAPTDEEVKAQFDAGAATLYKDKKFDEVKASITEELKQTKLRDAFLTWFADIKKEAKVKNFGL
jgi:parvulin-like peptidyl-prolyl isomerase